MNWFLYAAALLTVGVGLAHSFLGERYILVRLFRRDGLPPLLGGTAFTRNTLRFAWHLTTLAWFGYAGILVLMAADAVSPVNVGRIVGVVFGVSALVTGVMSRGRHLAWVAFLAIALVALLAAGG